MDVDSVLKLLAAGALVLLNGFFVAAEFSLVKVRATRIEELSRRGSLAAKVAQREVEHLNAYLSATQLGITLASLGLGWIGEPAFAHLIEPIFAAIAPSVRLSSHALAVVIAFIVITFLHIVFGEMAPKTLAIVKPETTTLWVAYPLHWFYRLFYIPIELLNGSANLVLRALGLGPTSEHDLAHSEEELRMILLASEEQGTLEPREVDMVEHVFEFGDTCVHEVMVPRVDMVYLSREWSMARVLEVAKERPHTRYILVEDEDLDRVVGFVHLKDLLHLTQRRTASLDEIRRDLLVVPENQRIDRLLRTFQQNRVQIALVLDEYGGTAGMVTLQDLIEEIVGEVPDEFQTDAPRIEERSDGSLVMAGTTPLSEITERLGLDFGEQEFDTVGGYVMGELGRLPEPGDEVEVRGYTLKVTQMAGQRIQQIELRPREGTGSAVGDSRAADPSTPSGQPGRETPPANGEDTPPTGSA